MVIATHTIGFEQLVGKLKANATSTLSKARCHPFLELELKSGKHHTCWGGRAWITELFREEQILERIRYVEENPVKAGLRLQTWKFVLRYPQLNLI